MIWLALAVAVLLWWLMTGLALMSVHQPQALRQPIFLLATIFATVCIWGVEANAASHTCLLYTSPSPRDKRQSRMPSSA